MDEGLSMFEARNMMMQRSHSKLWGTGVLFLSIAILAIFGCHRGPSEEDINLLMDKAEKERVAGKYTEAEAKYFYIAKNTREVMGPTSKAYAQALDMLALCWGSMGRHGGADSAYKTAEAILRRYPEMDSVRAASLFGHASNKLGQDKDSEAIQLFTEGLQISEKLWGPTDPHADKFLEALDVCYVKQRDFSQTLPIVERRLSVNLMNPDFRPAVLEDVIIWLWKLYFNVPQSLERGDQFFRRAVAAVDSGMSHDRRPVPYLQTGFAGFLASEDKRDECAAMLKTADSSARETFGRDTPEFAEYVRFRARVFRELGWNEQADVGEKMADSLKKANTK
jgi:hypothetical protein